MAGLRPPRQERSRKTLDRIVRAALALVAEKGVEATSVQEIVDRADSSVGSFYARFDGKADLVRYLEHRVWGEARERWDAAVADGAWTDAPLPELLEGVVGLLVRIERTDAAGRRALAERTASPDDAAPWNAETFRDHVAGDVRTLLLARRSEITHPDPETASDVLLGTLMGAVRELASHMEDASLVRELTRVGRSYLGGEADTGPDREDDDSGMDFFDVWG